MSDVELLAAAVMIARGAGDEILEVYQRGDRAVTMKADDSPLTEADTRAHEVIVAGLQRVDPAIPILSEESAAENWERRRHWSQYWLVDPLDGTKEFISRNGEFTVNIALIRDGQPVLGVVHVPVTDVCYSGLVGRRTSAAYRQVSGAPAERISARPLQKNRTLRVVASRRHGGEELQDFLDKLSPHFPDINLVNMGSSLKICLLAEGKADLYPRLAPTSEWDTAAAHAILRAAGGELYRPDFQVLRYNQKESLLNPNFIAVAYKKALWPELLGARQLDSETEPATGELQ